MKKIRTLLVIAIVSACFITSINAQTIRFGIKGGVTLSGANLKSVVDAGESQTYTGFNAGIALNVKLILGFSIQPELVYTQTGMKFGLTDDHPSASNVVVSHGMIELPLNVQWGIKLGPVRPYIQASPYIGYSVLNKMDIGGSVMDMVDSDKFQYGMSLGGGIDIWKFQISYRYKWNLNSLEWSDIVEGVEKTKIRGSEINLTFFF